LLRRYRDGSITFRIKTSTSFMHQVHQFFPHALSRLCENNMPQKSKLNVPYEAHFPQPYCGCSLFWVTTLSTCAKSDLKTRASKIEWLLSIFDSTRIVMWWIVCILQSIGVLHLDYIGPLKVDDKGHSYILFIIDTCSLLWVELFPTTSASPFNKVSKKNNLCSCSYWTNIIYLSTGDTSMSCLLFIGIESFSMFNLFICAPLFCPHVKPRW